MKIVTGKGRFSYLNWASPKLNDLSKKMEFSTEFLIPKEDIGTIANIKQAMKAALDKKYNGNYPKNLRSPLRDGDTEVKQDGTALDAHYKNHFFIRCKSNEAPGVVDENRQPILIANEFVSGDYGRVSITAYAYSQVGNNGVAFWLNNLQRLEKGEPLGGKASPQDDFGGGIPAFKNDGVPF